MFQIQFHDSTFEVHRTDTKCPVCGNSDFVPVLTVSGAHKLQRSLELVECIECRSMYFSGEDPVIGYDFEGFEADYWYNYVQNGAGITAMLEPILAIREKNRETSVPRLT